MAGIPLSQSQPLTFVDVFAGCGGLSLGLMQAGLHGLFAVERDSHAFLTLKTNLVVNRSGPRFRWPDWLPAEAHDIHKLTKDYKQRLLALRGQVDLVVGGPPCQGFSSAGRRDPDDPRNQLFRRYLRMIGLIQPKFLLIENVRGITVEFSKKSKKKSASKKAPEAYSQKIQRGLKRYGYETFPMLLRSVDFGVPQFRPRYFMIGVRKDVTSDPDMITNPFDAVPNLRKKFLSDLGLAESTQVKVRQAISDLRITGTRLQDCADTKGFKEIVYRGPVSNYQKQMHGSMNGHAPNSLRLPNHSEPIVERFTKLVKHARKGVTLSDEERLKFGVKKQSFVILDKDSPSHTLTTLPDDYLHYSEPRILTVREYARIQSFPDSFAFCGAYTTGGERRKKMCPRYTQVGNAVPPRLACFLGKLLKQYARKTLR